MAAYACQACDFKTPIDEVGATLMQQHLKSEHGIAFAGEFRKCMECDRPVLVMLGGAAPKGCQEHGG